MIASVAWTFTRRPSSPACGRHRSRGGKRRRRRSAQPRNGRVETCCRVPKAAAVSSRSRKRRRRSPNERYLTRPGSTLAHRPTVHGAAPVRGWRNVDKKLIVFAAAEFQELAWPFVSGEDPAAHNLAGDGS